MKTMQSGWVGAAIVAGLLIAGGAARGASFTWGGGGGDNNWSTLANWSPVPTGVSDLTGADLLFSTTAGSAGGSTTAPATTENDIVGLSVNSLQFPGTVNNTLGWRIEGSGLTVGAGGLTVTASNSGRSIDIAADRTFEIHPLE